MEDDAATAAARERMIQKRFGGGTGLRTGGKGSIRRKKKAVHKTATADDKKLGSTLKKLGVSPIPGIEEVNMFKKDGSVAHFVNPKVQASIAANTYVVSGSGEDKQLQELLPGIIHQLGPDGMSQLKMLAEQMSAMSGGAGMPDGMGGAGMGMPGIAEGGPAGGADGGEDSDDEGVPDLVENFEKAAATTGDEVDGSAAAADAAAAIDKEGEAGEDGK